MKLRSIHQIVEQKLVKRSIDIRALTYGDEQEAGGQQIKQTVSLVSGIEKDDAKKIIKLIKDSKAKVQAQIQDDQVRVTSKKIDELQGVIQTLKDKRVWFTSTICEYAELKLWVSSVVLLVFRM